MHILMISSTYYFLNRILVSKPACCTRKVFHTGFPFFYARFSAFVKSLKGQLLANVV